MTCSAEEAPAKEEEKEEKEKTAAAPESPDALADLKRGDYDEAIAGFKKVVDAVSAKPKAEEEIRARRGWAEALAATGKQAEALAVLRPEGKPPPAALAGPAGRILRRSGKLDEARGLLEKALEAEGIPLAARVECLVELGRSNEEKGRNEEARKAYEASIQLYKDMDSDDAEALPAETFVHWALALIGLNRYGEANEPMFQQAEEKDPKCLLALLERGKAFFAKYNFPGSRELLKEALGLNPHFAEAMAALAENYLADFQAPPDRFDQAEKLCSDALEVNPHLVDAFVARGGLWLYDGNYRRAIEDFQQALTEDPASLRARGLLAACRLLAGDKKEYEKEEAAARETNPRGAEFYHTVALALERRFRYVDTVKMCDRALELDPDYWPAYMTLAINCLRTGENARGRQFLDRSWEKDPFNVWVLNFRKLLRFMDKNHRTVEDGGFACSFPKEDSAILTAYLIPLLKEAREKMEARYKTRLEGVIQVEDFSSHEMFSGRTVGLPGFAATGATFGKLITLTTPKAFPQNWGVVAWHEFAHVIALKITDHRVPRWLTEGLSVYEEGLDHPQWARNFQRELADAWASRRLLSLSEIDFGFSKPKYPQQILISYFQGCMVVKLIVERWGFDKVLEILRGYRDEKSTEQVFREALGMSLPEFDREFEGYMSRWVEGTGYRPRVDLDKAALAALEAKVEDGPKDARKLTDLAWAYLCAKDDVDAALTASRALEADPKCGDAHAVVGIARLMDKKTRQADEAFEKALAAGTRFAALCHAQIGSRLAKEKDSRAKAIEHLEEAKKISPIAVAGSPPQGNIYYQLAKLYEEGDDEERANQQMVELAKFQVEDPECRQRIVKYALLKKDPATAIKYLEELMYINPFEEKYHALLARAAADAGNHDLVIRENEVLLTFSDSNPRQVRLALAKAWMAKGERAKAAVEAKRVLGIDPDHEEAKEILRKATEK